jgi:hypothetical protein
MEEPRADGAGLGVELGLGFRDASLLLLDPDNKQIQQCYIRNSGHFIYKYTTIYLYEVLISMCTRWTTEGIKPDWGH